MRKRNRIQFRLIKNLIRVLFALILWQLFAVSPSFAHIQTQKIFFSDIQKSFGLDDLPTSALLQDSDGFIWIGASSGAYRFDGSRLKSYTPQNSGLSEAHVTQLLEDPFGYLWLGTHHGLNRLNKQTSTIEQFFHDPIDPKSLSSDHFPSGSGLFFADRFKRLWFGSSNGLNLYRPSSKTFQRIQHVSDNPHSLSSNHIIALTDTPDGKLWVATKDAGLNLYDPSTKMTKRYPLPIGLKAMAKDSTGDLWLVNGSIQLIHFSERTRKHQTINKPPDSYSVRGFDNILLMPSGKLLLSDKRNHTLLTYDPVSKQYANLSFLLPTSSHSLLKDNSDNIWISSLDGDVYVWNLGNEQFRHIGLPKEQTIDPITAPLLEDHLGNLWLGGNDQHLIKLSPSGESSQLLSLSEEQLPNVSNDVLALHQDEKKRFFVATERGLTTMHFDNTGANFQLVSPQTFQQLASDSIQSDILWGLNTQAQLCRIHKSHGVQQCFAATEHANEQVHSPLKHDPKAANIIWFSSTTHLLKFDSQFATFERFPLPVKQAALQISDLQHDQLGQLWLATDRGLYRFDKQHQVFMLYSNSDLDIGALVLDNHGYIWLGSSRGLFKFDPLSEIFLKRYTQRQGLMSHHFSPKSSLRSNTGALWFYNGIGLLRFDPRRQQENTLSPPVYLTRLSHNGRTIPSKVAPEHLKKLTLKWPINSFEFEYAALNYFAPKNNQYAYKLDGFDTQWVSAGNQTQGRYTNLTPGHYTLRVKAANNDGVWNDIGVSLPLLVQAPFWRSRTFAYTFIALLGLLLFCLVRARFKSSQQKNRELQQQLIQKEESLSQTLTTLKDQQKHVVALQNSDQYKHLIAGVAYDLHQVSSQYLNQLSPNPTTDTTVHASHTPQRLQVDQGMLLTLNHKLFCLNQIAGHQAKHQVVNIHLRTHVGIILQLITYRHQHRPIHILNQIPDTLFLRNYPDTLFHVLTSLLDNTLVHAYPFSTGGKVHIDAQQTADTLTLSYKDDGIGLSQESQERLFEPHYSTRRAKGDAGLGMSIVYQMVTQIMMGEVQIVSQAEQPGFHIHLQLPNLQLSPSKIQLPQ